MITLAKIARSRGRRGELLGDLLGSTSVENLPGRTVFLRRNREATPFLVQEAWLHNGRAVLKLAGIDSIEAAELWRGADLCIPALERQPLAPGEIYFDDLIGCAAMDLDSGEQLGTVRGWYETGAVPLIAVERPDSSELLVPFARTIFEDVDISNRRLGVRLPDGLKDLNRE
ncbi:MAG: 16S rRNA processing protein RimM [Bryobacterales bacterium]|nr:16S rRNA processing protein RimM [Bryobacterales bacterium]